MACLSWAAGTLRQVTAAPTLVVMAAGLGTRFGGDKQIAEVGPDGETFLDFAIADSMAAGVERVVLIVRSELHDEIRRHVAERHGGLDVAYVCQDRFGPPRAKPWGTAHAVLSVADEVAGPLLVVNADDYYGVSTYSAVCAAAEGLPDDRALLAGFRLDRTLPTVGEVSRGVCETDGDELLSLIETHRIARRDDGAIVSGDPSGVLAPDAVVSMNCWVFSDGIFGHLEQGFAEFAAEHAGDSGEEYLLPTVVTELMRRGGLTVGVVPTAEPWVGVTNPADLEIARRRLAVLRC